MAAELELQDVVVADSAETLACADLLSALHADILQITVYGDIESVAHHDYHFAGIAEYTAHLTIEYGAG